MKKLVILFLFLSVQNLYSQTDTVARVDILSGSSLTMHFNSFDRITNGIEYSNWTVLKAYFVATNLGVPTAARWRLSVRSNTATIIGDGGNTLDTRTVQLIASSGGLGTDNPLWQNLTNSDIVLVDNGTNPVNTGNITVSYRCGYDPTYPLTGATTDYYFVDLVFTFELIP